LNSRYRLREAALLYFFDTEKHGQGKAKNRLPFPVAGIWHGIRADSDTGQKTGLPRTSALFSTKMRWRGRGPIFCAPPGGANPLGIIQLRVYCLVTRMPFIGLFS